MLKREQSGSKVRVRNCSSGVKAASSETNVDEATDSRSAATLFESSRYTWTHETYLLQHQLSRGKECGCAGYIPKSSR